MIRISDLIIISVYDIKMDTRKTGSLIRRSTNILTNIKREMRKKMN